MYVPSYNFSFFICSSCGLCTKFWDVFVLWGWGGGVYNVCFVVLVSFVGACGGCLWGGVRFVCGRLLGGLLEAFEGICVLGVCGLFFQ